MSKAPTLSIATMCPLHLCPAPCCQSGPDGIDGHGGRPVRIGKFSYQSNGKALASGETEGFVKTIFDAETGELLGAHMAGAQVTEQIQVLASPVTRRPQTKVSCR